MKSLNCINNTITMSSMSSTRTTTTEMTTVSLYLFYFIYLLFNITTGLTWCCVFFLFFIEDIQNGSTTVSPLGFSLTFGSQPVMVNLYFSIENLLQWTKKSKNNFETFLIASVFLNYKRKSFLISLRHCALF